MVVLVVDDDSSIRLLCRVNLEFEGHRVLEAATLDEALEQLGEAELVLLDLTVGAERGLQVVQPIRDARPDVPIVLLTGAAEVPPEIRSQVSSVLPKPFTIEALVAAARSS